PRLGPAASARHPALTPSPYTTLFRSDCHRNDINHMTERGYEGEPTPASVTEGNTVLTCRGCHLGDPHADSTANRLGGRAAAPHPDRKSTRLNSSHQINSYAVFCFANN